MTLDEESPVTYQKPIEYNVSEKLDVKVVKVVWHVSGSFCCLASALGVGG